MRSVSAVLTSLLMVAASPAPSQNAGDRPAIENFKEGDARRELVQNPTGLLERLKISRGDWVADVGAGGGYYSMRMGQLTGSDGRVFAEEIDDISISTLNLRVRLFNLANVEVVKGEPEDPKLPQSRLTAVLVIDTYHHFENYHAMLDKILHALKPGGRLVIADFSLTEHRSLPRADQLKQHEIAAELARAEAVEAGFQVSSIEDPFVKWRPESWRPNAADMWVMVLVRPNP
jgi:precorrin-6B methylase 2